MSYPDPDDSDYEYDFENETFPGDEDAPEGCLHTAGRTALLLIILLLCAFLGA